MRAKISMNKVYIRWCQQSNDVIKRETWSALFYGAPFVSKLFAKVMFNVEWVRDVTFSTLISFYYLDGTFSTLISSVTAVMQHFLP